MAEWRQAGPQRHARHAAEQQSDAEQPRQSPQPRSRQQQLWFVQQRSRFQQRPAQQWWPGLQRSRLQQRPQRHLLTQPQSTRMIATASGIDRGTRTWVRETTTTSRPSEGTIWHTMPPSSLALRRRQLPCRDVMRRIAPSRRVLRSPAASANRMTAPPRCVPSASFAGPNVRLAPRTGTSEARAAPRTRTGHRALARAKRREPGIHDL